VTNVVLTPEELAGETATIEKSEGDAYRHLFRARRLAVGDRVRAVDGAGRARWAEIESVDRRAGVLRLGDEAPANEPIFRLELLVATPKKERASWLVEKATELGVSAVRFVASERSPRDWGGGTRDRLVRMAVSAVEQCGRARVPEVTGVHAWEEVPGLLEGLEDRWLLHPAEEGAPEGAEDGGFPPPAGTSGAVLVGPEGGWTDAEADELRSLGCRPVHLGERVLRVETAAIVASGFVLLK
jgi:16S rRNA (uracil1498-N3)-methyltransferase